MQPKKLTANLMHLRYPHEKMQEPKKQVHFAYDKGPMYYLGQQIVRAMQDAGYPAKIIECYRSPKRQETLKRQGRSKAGPYESPHQFWEAVDIIHPAKGWNVSREYWVTLNACMRVVERKYGVDLVHGHDWNDNGVPVYDDSKERFYDAAHIEIKDWRKQQRLYSARKVYEVERPFDQSDLWMRFKEVLPQVAVQYERRDKTVPFAVRAAKRMMSAIWSGISKRLP